MIGTIVFIMGLFFGSFLNVCIYRIPRNQSIIFPPSRCPHCQKRLLPWDLIPILSFVLSGGHCRYCKSKISFQYPLVELLTGFVYLLVYQEFGLTTQGFLFFIFSSGLIVIGGIDAKHRLIPDGINLSGIVIGLGSALFLPQITFMDALLGAVIGSGLFLLIAILTRGGMGGGDIKMMAFVGAFLGVKGVLLTIFVGSLFGSFYGLYLMLFKNAHRKTAIPYGPFLALGAFIIALYGDELLNIYFQMILRW